MKCLTSPVWHLGSGRFIFLVEHFWSASAVFCGQWIQSVCSYIIRALSWFHWPSGLTALRRGGAKVCAALLEHSEFTVRDTLDCFGRMALHYAARGGHQEASG